MENNKSGFSNVLSEYQDMEKGVRSQVIFDGKKYGCNFYNQNKLIKTEYYPGKSESWAESAAENYVLGVKQLDG